jgi:hypothetical protein
MALVLNLQRGDFASVSSGTGISKAIRVIEQMNSKRNVADYTHSLVIDDPYGTTIESLGHIRYNSLDSYIGKEIIILRWDSMTIEKYADGKQAIMDNVGQIYPFWRIPMFIVPVIAKYATTRKFPVCSELAAKMLYHSGLLEYIGRWEGWDPQDIADLRFYKDISVVGKGTLGKFQGYYTVT